MNLRAKRHNIQPDSGRRASVYNRKYKKAMATEVFKSVGVCYGPFPTAYEATLASVEYRFRVDRIFS